MSIRGKSHHARHTAPARIQGCERARIVILASRFHQPITSALAEGATHALESAGILPSHIQLLWVPGAFELPVSAAQVAHVQPAPHAIIALGALIKGETAHYAVIGNAVACGLTEVAVRTRIPIAFGVILAETPAQAKARAGGAVGNRGIEAAEAALAMLELSCELQRTVGETPGKS